VALGWICWLTGSVYPGMVMHVLHNSIMLSLIYAGPRLEEWNIDERHYLPLPLVLATTVVAFLAAFGIVWQSRRSSAVIEPASAGQPAGTNAG
jgi:sodium transport system permease protein